MEQFPLWITWNVLQTISMFLPIISLEEPMKEIKLMNIEKNLLVFIQNICRNYPTIEKVILFGSRARGDHTQKSDYDLAIYGQLQPSEIVLLRNALREDLPTLHKIDTVFMQSETDSKLIKNIENEGILIYDKTCQ